MTSSVTETLHHTLRSALSFHPTTRTYNGCFPLPFTARTDAGNSGKEYLLENLSQHDHSVWSSAAPPPTFIVFKSAARVTVTEMLVKIPRVGFTCPAREIDVMLFEEDSGEGCLLAEPLCRLNMTVDMDPGFVKHVFTRPIPDVKSALMAVKSVWGESGENVDLQYVAFGGYRGPHAFPSASFL
jgi:hypothetical protein